ncbi:hypothetical protein Tco_0368994 [Tanacetum coccineum]
MVRMRCPYGGWGDSLVRASTTASSLEAEQDIGNINKTQSKATPNESSSQGTNSGGGPRCQETMGDTIAQTRFESVSKHSNDSLLAREKTKTTQHNEIVSLKRRVKKLEKKDSWNDPRDFAKPVKAISLSQDVLSTSDRRLIELENQVRCLMKAHLDPKPSIQVNKITSSCEICSGPYDTQYYMENPEQAFDDYASLRTNEVGGNTVEIMEINATRDMGRDAVIEVNEKAEEELDSFEVFEKVEHESDESEEEVEEEIKEEEDDPEYFNTFPTVEELEYHDWILKNPRPV